MCVSKWFKKTIISLLLCLACASLFGAEPYVEKAYKQLDVAFEQKSKSELSSVLLTYVDDKFYYLIEYYAKKKVRRLVLENNYTFAIDAIYIIIDINLDSGYEDDNAIEMYRAITDAYALYKKKNKIPK